MRIARPNQRECHPAHCSCAVRSIRYAAATPLAAIASAALPTSIVTRVAQRDGADCMRPTDEASATRVEANRRLVQIISVGLSPTAPPATTELLLRGSSRRVPITRVDSVPRNLVVSRPTIQAVFSCLKRDGLRRSAQHFPEKCARFSRQKVRRLQRAGRRHAAEIAARLATRRPAAREQLRDGVCLADAKFQRPPCPRRQQARASAAIAR